MLLREDPFGLVAYVQSKLVDWAWQNNDEYFMMSPPSSRLGFGMFFATNVPCVTPATPNTLAPAPS